MSWLLQNILTLAILLAAFIIGCFMSRREYWRLAAKEVFSRKSALISACILALYLAVAVADSVGWRNPAKDPVTGEILRAAGSGKVIYDNGQSLLDRILTPLRERQEFSYSAPLADHLHAAETVTTEDGAMQRVNPPLRHPGSHLLGTDRIGTDVLYLSLKSIRTGIIVGLLTTIIAIPFALLMGIMAGFFGGIADDIIQYIYTVISSIPTVLFIAAFIVIFGTGLPQLCVAMGLASWTSLCRLLRAETLKLREAEFVSAAKALGVPAWRIIIRHILPNVLHVVIITTGLRFSTEVLAEAVLTYLGIGVDAQTMSWGTMINDARSELTRDPVIWWKLFAAFIFMLGLVLPANIFGDAVRDALDPRLRTR
ncbi:MAG: ABC transporter permease [Victivallales bacterium]|nr:ABC transporter permease [Victivallales bacterium]